MADVTPSVTAETDVLKASASQARAFPTTVSLPVTGPIQATSSSVASIAEEPFVPVYASSDD